MRKITDAVVRIVSGKLECLELGNLSARCDRGYADDYVEGMAAIFRADQSDTFVLATGNTTSIRDFVSMTFKVAGIDLKWTGKAGEERGIDAASGVCRVRVNPRFYRPAEVDLLIGGSSKSETVLGQKARTSLENLCKMMFDADLGHVRQAHEFAR